MSSGANMQTRIYASRSAARVCLIGVIAGEYARHVRISTRISVKASGKNGRN